jgi:hypothetical protein
MTTGKDGGIMLKWFFYWDGKKLKGYIWLRIMSSGLHL